MRRWWQLGALVVGVSTGMMGVAGAHGWAQANTNSGAHWRLLKNAHFEVYSEAGADQPVATLRWFEQLRAFFDQNGMASGNRVVRVVSFASLSEYDAFRPSGAADAFYSGNHTRDYIVMPRMGGREFAIAAHEYAHLTANASGMELPLWLSEGLAEYFSTVRIAEGRSQVGGPIAGHLELLRRGGGMPIRRMLAETAAERARQPRSEVAGFYAESWALADLLLGNPEYRAKMPELLEKLRSGMASQATLEQVYGRGLEPIAADLRTWIAHRGAAAVTLPGVATAEIRWEESGVSECEAEAVLADLSFTGGALKRAAELYRAIEEQCPAKADAAAALGTIALAEGDREGARAYWRRGMEEGLSDAKLVYQYALIAEDSGAKQEEIRSALERAVSLDPEFDDARYKLGLLESNAGAFEAALAQFQAMKNVPQARRYTYWTSVSYAAGEVGRREQAKAAADKALAYATNEQERVRARQLRYTANTDLKVEFTRDADGQLRLETTRVQHGAAWNPFIEPGEEIHRAVGKLETVECGGGKVTGMAVETEQGRLELAIPDPQHVLMRNAPAEFACGPQPAHAVEVEYAAVKGASPGPFSGVLRGMEFR